MARPKSASGNGKNGANLGFEATLWLAADKLRNNMDAGEYKHVVLGLIFLKYISDAFEERHAALEAELSTFEATDVLLAPEEILDAFDGNVTPLFIKVRSNAHQSRTRATLRDALLPKLLTGEVRVKEAERAVAEVV